jgi:RimJ/RimL family protein N-acetyltransferase
MTETTPQENAIQTTILKCKTVKEYKRNLVQMPVIIGDIVLLGPVPENPEFCQLYKKWLENESIIKGTGDDKRAYTHEEVSLMFQEWKEDPEDFTLCIFEKESNAPVGDINLLDTVEFDDGPELKIMIGEKQGKGRGSEAMRLLLDYAFNTIGLETINLSVYKDNIPAFSLFKKFGFSIIGEKTDSDNGKEEYVMKLRFNEFLGKNSHAGIINQII